MLQTETRPASLVRAETRDGIRILTLDSPPVNALGSRLCAEVIRELEAAIADSAVTAIVFAGANGLFSGGADVNEFQAPPPPGSKNIRDVIATVEKSDKTFVAAIDGNALGGALELALACDYRVGSNNARVGLPEILLGLLPGAGGTQRLPRLLSARNPMNNGLAGVQMALDMMLKGESKNATQAKGMGILDDVALGAVERAVELAKTKAGTKARVSRFTFIVLPSMTAMAHGMVPPEERGGLAAHKLIDAVEAASEMEFKYGLAHERRLFEELVRSGPAQAAIHLFFAERELGKIPNLAGDVKPKEIKSAAVVGAGTMGTGIAMVFANAGIPVSVIDVNPEQVERGRANIASTYEGQVKKGRIAADVAKARTEGVKFVGDYAAIADVDVVIEAVFESMKVKKEVFAALDKALKPGAILASNTSTLDIDEMASMTSRPGQVVGLHFFAPANIMQLLEIVRGKSTSDETLVTATALAKRLRKKGVVSGNAFGFIGNRMLFDYIREANFLLEEGATPMQIDGAMKDFGFPMGPFGMSDLSGIDVFYKISLEAPKAPYRTSEIAARLYEQGRYGQKTGKGFFIYEDGKREPVEDPGVNDLIAAESKRLGIKRRRIKDEEIVERCIYALINEGARIIEDGIAQRSSDIDLVYLNGYGFPAYRGGPMFFADQTGLHDVVRTLKSIAAQPGSDLGVWTPAPLLARLAHQGQTFSAFKGQPK